MKINNKIILHDYNFLKNKAKIFYGQGEYEKALSFINVASRIAYALNFCFADDDFEKLLQLISIKLIKVEIDDNLEEKYLFYDSFGLDNRCLTQQYIRALISWDKPFLYILEDGSNISKAQNILKELNEYPKCEIQVIPSSYSNVEKIKYIAEIILNYKPSKAFLQFAPWSVVGICVFNAFPQITRYLINLTDHAFWLGKYCSDYIIEFREFGVNISLKFRGISNDKLLIQPFYPIQANNCFKGFPIDISNKIILFTGGHLYKIYGDNEKFFTLIKHILENNLNAILFIAGSGNARPLQKFIKKNKFEKRIIQLGDREDINEVIKHIDIYIGTYPIAGGLMSQLAAMNGKPIAAFTKDIFPCNFIEGFINVKNKVKLTFTSEELFLNEVTKLIQNKEYRSQRAKLLDNSILSEHNFNLQLKLLIDKNINCNAKNIDISLDAISQLYLEVENKFSPKYYLTFSSIKQYLFYNVDLMFRFILYIIFNNRKLIISKLLKLRINIKGL